MPVTLSAMREIYRLSGDEGQPHSCALHLKREKNGYCVIPALQAKSFVLIVQYPRTGGAEVRRQNEFLSVKN